MKFLSPFNLIYLSLALIPIIIHFLSKFKNREIYFPTVKLFKTILKHEIGKLRIKEILHLILRTLALTLLLLTFSKPQIADSNNSANEINLIIDNSYSMEPVKGKIIHSLHNINAKVINLYLLSGEKKRFFSKKSLIDYVRENISTYGSFTLNSLTGKLDTSIKTLLITDLDKKTFKNVNWNFLKNIYVYPFKHSFYNVKIKSITQTEEGVNVKLYNISNKDIKIIVYLFSLNDDTLEKRNSILLKKESQTIHFRYNIGGGYVKITGDSISGDNIFYFHNNKKRVFLAVNNKYIKNAINSFSDYSIVRNDYDIAIVDNLNDYNFYKAKNIGIIFFRSPNVILRSNFFKIYAYSNDLYIPNLNEIKFFSVHKDYSNKYLIQLNNGLNLVSSPNKKTYYFNTLVTKENTNIFLYPDFLFIFKYMLNKLYMNSYPQFSPFDTVYYLHNISSRSVLVKFLNKNLYLTPINFKSRKAIVLGVIKKPTFVSIGKHYLLINPDNSEANGILNKDFIKRLNIYSISSFFNIFIYLFILSIVILILDLIWELIENSKRHWK